MTKGKTRMLTINEVAERTGAAKSSLRVWLSNDEERAKRFPNAKKETTPVGSYWLIPESDLKGFTARGRGRPYKPESKRSKAHKADESKKASKP
jgi:hypothetical protein